MEKKPCCMRTCRHRGRWAFLGLGAGLGAGAAAVVTLDRGGDADLDVFAGDRLFQRQRQVVAQVGAAVGAPAAATTAEDVAEDIAEDVGEAAGAEVAGTAAEAALTADAGMAELIVGGALAGVRQHVVGLLGLLELGQRLGVVRIAVRVVLHRQPAKRLLDVLLAGVAAEAEDFVIIALGHGRSSTSGLVHSRVAV
jgi:hypothetical protein